MQGRLSVKTSKLVETSGEFSTINGQVRGLCAEMMSLVAEMKSYWVGTAAENYGAKFTGLEDDMAKINKKIEKYITDLQSMAEVYDRAEAENVEEATGLPGDVIS